MNGLLRIRRFPRRSGDALIELDAVKAMLPLSAEQIEHCPDAADATDNHVDCHQLVTSAQRGVGLQCDVARLNLKLRIWKIRFTLRQIIAPFEDRDVSAVVIVCGVVIRPR